MRLTVTIALAFLFVLGLPVASAKDTLASEPAVDLSKIMGTWYVIARMPNPVERGHVTSRDEYTLVEDGKVAVRYLYREGFGEPEKEVNARASVDAESGNRDWRVWFYKVIPAKQRILEIAPDGSWMLISYPGRDLAWIFARKPDMSRDQYRKLVDKMRDDYSIYTDKLKRVPQLREQVDRLGFEVPSKR
ncbi:apolipoprotein D and lipocalin family protein [Xanthomonas arboricola]|uniref:lipocalin family protein n=1 Tax=Xanthomonas euroxanthea TaxID=2259622 RepID=UPI00141AD60B|nr:lipocalin family protein [Xanthomonas euroxanthea]NIK08408.1 apolipoprotein D and lipocalin family protein [Xanthomonas euroxanthea]